MTNIYSEPARNWVEPGFCPSLQAGFQGVGPCPPLRASGRALRTPPQGPCWPPSQDGHRGKGAVGLEKPCGGGSGASPALAAGVSPERHGPHGAPRDPPCEQTLSDLKWPQKHVLPALGSLFWSEPHHSYDTGGSLLPRLSGNSSAAGSTGKRAAFRAQIQSGGPTRRSPTAQAPGPQGGPAALGDPLPHSFPCSTWESAGVRVRACACAHL